MKMVDRVVLVGASVSIGIMGAVIVAFCEGIYKPIKHDMDTYPSFGIKRHTDAENEAQSRLRVVDSVSEPIIEWKG